MVISPWNWPVLSVCLIDRGRLIWIVVLVGMTGGSVLKLVTRGERMSDL